MAGPVDFSTVQWARKMSALAQNLAGLSPADLRKLSNFLDKLADLREQEAELSDQQLQVIMQGLRSKDLVRLALEKGGVLAEFSGGGFEYERFLIRADGKVPNSRYETKKVGG
ncbi:MAG TPA: hypothetical protein VEC93_25050 [Anaerolineae bacterium]|nr:hypothetical protein [Anaerolineae bacterium]